jgi:ribonuclease HI
MPWRRYRLRGSKVYARVAEDGALAPDARGRVEIRYRLDASQSYQAAARNLEPLPDEPAHADPEAAPAPSPPAAPRRQTAPAPPGDAIIVYTDGACTGNPGPMGIGVVLLAGSRRKEISEYLGPRGTNNIAELTAIERALESIKDRQRTVIVHSDSAYAIGVIGMGWKAKLNTELVERIRALARRFHDLRFVKVSGHAGVVENERCDELAREAITRGAN